LVFISAFFVLTPVFLLRATCEKVRRLMVSSRFISGIIVTFRGLHLAFSQKEPPVS
jgi:hypothetical protein